MVRSTGMELLLDLHDCREQALNDPNALERILTDSVCAAGFEIVSRAAHQFTHQGVTLVLILSQSHVVLHTWPEEKFAAVDLYVCGDKKIVEHALELMRADLIARFSAQAHSHRIVERASS